MGSLICFAVGNLAITILLLSLTPSSLSLNFHLSSFSPDDTVVLLEGDAVVSVGRIELNKVNYLYRVGRVVYNGKVPLWDSNSAKLADFTTHFSFIIDTQNRSAYGNGLAFFLAPAGFEIPPNSGGGFLGLFNTSTTGSSRNQIVSVEFDSYPNPEWDPPYEHVGINRDSIASSSTAPWNVTLHDGEPADVWITYTATTKNLTVFWSYNGASNSSLSYQIDLKAALPQLVTVGITAATGVNVERHMVQSWEFSSSLDVEESNGNEMKKVGAIVGVALSACILIAGAIVVAYIVMKKRRDAVRREAVKSASLGEDLERGAGPRRFSYEELASATNNFSEDRKQGEGGFGGVYKGRLADLDMPVAVKRISKGSRQGKREYITEVKTISMLRHRNLVQLIGWCHDEGEFMLVYEFMPNGSLDRHLFGRRATLGWTVRYKIALGLASALLYLHEEWEQCVVHRDIKSSNVMLDANFNVKLGDFGLARLMDHGIDPKTTRLAGTLGYLAPEYVSSGRASKESDVYSFGVVALEIATGRRSADPMDEQSEKGLVEWVWDLYGDGELLSAADERLQTDFDPRQVERVMKVGLWCAHPDWNLRPSIRQASHALNFEGEVPKLPSKMPTPLYFAPASTPSVGSADPLLTCSSIDVGR